MVKSNKSLIKALGNKGALKNSLRLAAEISGESLVIKDEGTFRNVVI